MMMMMMMMMMLIILLIIVVVVTRSNSSTVVVSIIIIIKRVTSTRDEGVRVGLCVPRDGDINLYTYSPVWAPNIDRWSEVDTLEEIDQDTVGGKYFYDRTNG